MNEFFRFLAKKRLSENKFEETLSKWDSSKTIEFIEEGSEKLTPFKNKQSTDHSFVSNTQLSGGHAPCVAVECRLKHVDQLARFAALYADQVLIHDPFEYYGKVSEADVHVRKSLSDDLRVLYYLRPLLENGLISLATRTWHYCAEHYDEAIVKTKLLERLEKAEKALVRRFTRDAKVILDTSMIRPVFKIVGPDELIEHGATYRFSDAAQKLSDMLEARQNHVLTKKEIKKYHIFDGTASTIIHDIFIQNLYARNGFHYLTDREVDFDVIKAVNDIDTNQLNKAILEGLSHTVPFIHDVKLESLMKLRKNEGESFQVYRDSLNELLKSLSDEDIRNSKILKQAFNDSIRPELNKIDLTVKNSKKLLYGSIKQDIIFSAGFIGLGLFSGLLPPSVGELIAALGGYKFASSVAEKVNKSHNEPDVVRENKYYFLWKVKEENKRNFFRDLNRTVI
jgi:hypothetical protein